MELPPVTRNYFSSIPYRERVCRFLCFFLLIILVILLYYFWIPLRSTEFTYSMVAITVDNILVLLFFQAVTILGSEGFFLVFLSVIYWSVNKPLGFWGLVLMPLSIFVTSEIPKDIIKLPRPDVRGVTVPTYTFPSGHTSGAVSVWGYLAVVLRMRWFWVVSLIIMFLVGISRTMLGYHFLGDVLGGVVTGALFLIVFFWVAVRILGSNWKEKIPSWFLPLTALAVPLAMSYIPASFAPNLMGYVAGAGPGYFLERRYLGFLTGGNLGQHLARALIGCSVIALVIPGVDLVFPDKAHLITFIQHAVATFWTTYLAPCLFIKWGLAFK